MNSVYLTLLQTRQQRGGGFLLLIDPDRTEETSYLSLAEAAEECGVDALLVGTSFSLESQFDFAIRDIKRHASVPVVIFPGSFAQVSPHADAVLFTSLVSGRNPSFLIGEQVRGAPLVKRFGLETIPTAYLLIESGSETSVQFVTQTIPLPRNKADLACAHALAAQYLGMRLVYLEAGSGADHGVPDEMIRAVADYVDIPVMTGGGLCRPEHCSAAIASGASFAVVGTAVERDPSLQLVREMAAACHPHDKVAV